MSLLPDNGGRWRFARGTPRAKNTPLKISAASSLSKNHDLATQVSFKDLCCNTFNVGTTFLQHHGAGGRLYLLMIKMLAYLLS